MDCKTELESELDVMKRIVALLFGLAVLAERAAGRSYPVRCFVLWLMRQAEPVARCYVMGCEEDDSPSPRAAEPLASVHHRNSPAEAMHIAAILRTLACALADQLRLGRRFSRWWDDANAGEMEASGLEPKAQPMAFSSDRAENNGRQGLKRLALACFASAEGPQTGFT